eukprot:TRINITY_DN45664_c0_g1_i1.p2 TRINITY_DN45664_c0_g1~~TRINITY_DN45664_c0_g1_i1.p2  ORF type:complete len:283 (+),score=136.18 TRINITY_DN45664_c0_g1_i1:64-912(+)
MSGIKRMIRFVSEGRVFLGEQPAIGGTTASVLEGCPYNGSLKPTGETKYIEQLLSPIVPSQIFCIGLNYLAHFKESAQGRGVDLPTKPSIFVKSNSSLNHPESNIWLPKVEHGEAIDYEVELAVVIGKHARNVSKADALKYVAGYTVANDVTNRYWQKNAGADQWVKGKSFDTFSPLGPVLVSSAEITDPQNLKIQCSVNGELRQNSSTSDMIFNIPEVIEWLSAEQTLLPGTVIMTGTPEGVAAGMKDPKWLVHGDVVEANIEGIGSLRNFVVESPTASSA